ncbi:MAG: hypothetical protein IKO15_02730 [Clostridiales bacterium]|nr:hypothetical protein [Clostridiales bacterium]
MVGNSSDAESNCAKYIKESVLNELNIDVTYLPADSYDLVNGISPDISYTTQYNTITTFYRMNSVINIAPYLTEYSDSLTDLKNLLGDENLYSCTDEPSEVWFLSQKNTEPLTRITFIRKDWLDALGLESPSTRGEFYRCLLAFRDNAELLLGDDRAEMIPFFIDGDPSISAKPLLDSMCDPDINKKVIYVNGYNRVMQSGYKDGLEILNEWYLEGLIPIDFESIRPNTKESYEPIENGYVGAFCAKYDYLYANGCNSHISALHSTCGDEAEYVAVNTFENSNGEYTSWQEDYLNEDGIKVYLPATCSDPLACLVYLNWISNPQNISEVQNICDSSSYECLLLTCNGIYPYGKLDYIPDALKARDVALAVKNIRFSNKCVRYDTIAFVQVNTGIDYNELYPDSTKRFVCSVISSPAGEFDAVYTEKSDEYLKSGSCYIYIKRSEEWEKVVTNGDLTPT